MVDCRVMLTRPQYLALGPLRLAARSHVPRMRFSDRPTGGTDVARYCYAVWMRHLVMACRSTGFPFPRAVAELGPGDSIGIGLAALLSGVGRYFAFDVVAHTAHARNASILEELAALYRARAPIPGTAEFPNLKPDLADSRFPSDLVADAQLDAALARLDEMRAALRDGASGQMIAYVAPWFDSGLSTICGRRTQPCTDGFGRGG